MAGKVTAGLAESNGSLLPGLTMNMCHSEPGGSWWQPTTGFMNMHADCLESGIS